MSRVAIIGNTARAIGAVCASDLTLSGHEVRFTVFAELADMDLQGSPEAVKKRVLGLG